MLNFFNLWPSHLLNHGCKGGLIIIVCFYNYNKTGRLVLTTVEPEESAFISASAPVLLMSSVRSDSLTKENEHQVETTEGYTHIKKQNVRKRGKSAVLSPGSASSVRRSPRLKVWIKLVVSCISWIWLAQGVIQKSGFSWQKIFQL